MKSYTDGPRTVLTHAPRRPRASGNEAFTLIEIMIVVAIIAMLAAIAIPSFVEARERSRLVGCIQNLHVIDNATQRWALDAHKQSGEPVTLDDIRVYFKKVPVCPSGGTSFNDSYQITTVDEDPTCVRITSGKYAHKL